jgi:uncharacterized membrane protein
MVYMPWFLDTVVFCWAQFLCTFTCLSGLFGPYAWGVYETSYWLLLLLVVTCQLHYVFIFEFHFIPGFWLACTTTDSEIVFWKSHLLCSWELSREIVATPFGLSTVVAWRKGNCIQFIGLLTTHELYLLLRTTNLSSGDQIV